MCVCVISFWFAISNQLSFRIFSHFSIFFKHIPLHKWLSFSSSPLPYFNSLSYVLHHYIRKHTFISTSLYTESLLPFLRCLPSFLLSSLFLSFFLVFVFFVLLTLPPPLTNYSLLVVMATRMALSTSLL